MVSRIWRYIIQRKAVSRPRRVVSISHKVRQKLGYYVERPEFCYVEYAFQSTWIVLFPFLLMKSSFHRLLLHFCICNMESLSVCHPTSTQHIARNRVYYIIFGINTNLYIKKNLFILRPIEHFLTWVTTIKMGEWSTFTWSKWAEYEGGWIFGPKYGQGYIFFVAITMVSVI